MSRYTVVIFRVIFTYSLVTIGLAGCGGSSTSSSESPTDTNQPPVISLQGDAVVTVPMGSQFIDPGVLGIDPEEGDISYRVHVDSSVIDITQLGRYEIHYHVKDRQGLQSAQISRVVDVVMPQPSSAAEAARFLTRTTFGPTLTDIQDLQSMSYLDWLEQQFSAPATLQRPQLDVIFEQQGYMNMADLDNTNRRGIRGDIWWDTVVNADDQLRQRVAFALSQILVISEKDNELMKRVRGVADYHDLLISHAFGNYRDLLEAVTLHPMMGNYLSMRRNEKANGAGTIFPDENYAREIMQLFALGLDQLNLDGTLKYDQEGHSIPTYTAEDVRQLARVFTGWNYGDANQFRSNDRLLGSEVTPMRAFADYHDMGSKVIVGNAEIPAGLTPEQDLKAALDIIFQHPNVAPFISKQLIQKLVASNPSPQYVERVATVFEDNGQGVRGDLKAVVKAILVDYEALFGHRDTPQTFGKVKEPILKLSHLWRALTATPDSGLLRYNEGSSEFGQHILAASSVFNFFKPDHSPHGRLQQQGLVAPEFEIINESTLVTTQNRIFLFLMDHQPGGVKVGHVNFDYEPLTTAIADSPDALINSLNNLFFAGNMSSELQQILNELMTDRLIDSTLETRQRVVRNSLFIIFVSAEFALQS